jgi:flagellin-specific chaperone FliS
MEQEVPEDMVQMSREEFEEAVQQAATVMAQQQIQAHVQQGSIVQADEVIRLMRTALNGAPKAPENPLIDQVLNIVNYGVNSPMTKRHGR